MSIQRSRKRHSPSEAAHQSLRDLAQTVWGKPGEVCPKCKSEHTDYYDPFFFAPLRTLSGKRRIKCHGCGFIWRPSRSKRTFFSRLRP